MLKPFLGLAQLSKIFTFNMTLKRPCKCPLLTMFFLLHYFLSFFFCQVTFSPRRGYIWSLFQTCTYSTVKSTGVLFYFCQQVWYSLESKYKYLHPHPSWSVGPLVRAHIVQDLINGFFIQSNLQLSFSQEPVPH